MKNEWIDDLKEVLFIITRGEYLLQDVRNSMNVDAAAIFAQLDKQNFGYFYITTFQEWLSEQVGFTLNKSESTMIERRYSRGYRIT